MKDFGGRSCPMPNLRRDQSIKMTRANRSVRLAEE